jgi:nucleotide-binding universal stress UspA family protein
LVAPPKEHTVTRPANYVVAYEATDRGREALQLGIALARLTGAELRVCLVLPRRAVVPSKLASGDADYDTLLNEQAELWLREAAATVPDDVTATTHAVSAESTTEGLLQAADRFASDRIVVGAARAGLLGRFSIGSVASALLHASSVPVALAPRGYRAPRAVSRISCAIGTRSGWEALLDSMVSISRGLDVELRFVTLVRVDASRDAAVDTAAHLGAVLDYFTARSDFSGKLTTEVGVGDDIEDAVDAMDWRTDEIVFVGSSRLASPSRLFLGSTANRMLRTLPVPLIVVPA